MDVDPNILQIALAKAITESVPPEMHKEIFARAIHEHLFKANRDGKSPISDAFQRALDEATRDLAREVVREPENMQRIKETVQASLMATLEDASLLDKITKKLTGSFW